MRLRRSAGRVAPPGWAPAARWVVVALIATLGGLPAPVAAQAAPPGAAGARDQVPDRPRPPMSAPPQSAGARDELPAAAAQRQRRTEAGQAAFESGRFDEALALWRQAASDLPAGAAGDAERASLLYLQGRALSELDRHAEAAASLRQALALQQRQPPTVLLGALWHSLGDVLADMNDVVAARQAYTQALAARRAVRDDAGLVRTLGNAALLHNTLGEWGRARALIDEGTAVVEAAAARLRPLDLQRWWSAVGVVQAMLGQWAPAERAFARSAEISRQAGDRLGQAEALRNQAFVALEQGDPQASFDRHQAALAVLPADAREPRALALNGAGYALVRMGQGAPALPLLREALALQRAAPLSPELGRTLESLARAQALVGDVRGARASLAESLVITRETGARDDEREVLVSLARLSLQQAEPRAAVALLKQAVSLSETLRVDARSLDRASQRSLAQRLAEPYKLLAQLLIDQGRLIEAEQVLLSLKDAELQQYTRSGGGVATTLSDDERRLLAQLNALADEQVALIREQRALSADPQRRPQDSARMDERRKALAEQQLVALSELDRLLKPREAAPVEPALARLGLRDKATRLSRMTDGEPTVVLMYIPAEHLTTVLVTDNLGTRTVALDVGLATLAPLVSTLRLGLAERADIRVPAQALHRLLVQPVERALATLGPVPAMWMLYVTDELRWLPFAALMDEQGRYLTERVRLSQLVSSGLEQLLLPPQRWRVQAFGSTAAAPAQDLGPLPGAALELRGIVRDAANPEGVLPGVGFLDLQFTRARWNDVFEAPGQPAPEATVVHVASHFKANPGDWAQSFLLLGNGDEFRVAELGGMIDYSLSHLDLLTLSACETELHTSRLGGELEGFGALMLQRGARAVIGTLWKVQDESTALWMRRFYAARGEQRQRSKAAAVQQTQLAFLRGEVRAANPRIDLRHPYYWAPFVLMGNWL